MKKWNGKKDIRKTEKTSVSSFISEWIELAIDEKKGKRKES